MNEVDICFSFVRANALVVGIIRHLVLGGLCSYGIGLDNATRKYLSAKPVEVAGKIFSAAVG
jgi:hypothetical protein